LMQDFWTGRFCRCLPEGSPEADLGWVRGRNEGRTGRAKGFAEQNHFEQKQIYEPAADAVAELLSR